MPGSSNPRFRVTVWPTASRAIPPVAGVVADLVDGAIRYLQGAADVELPPELAIREIPRLASSDAAVLLAFTNQWGPLTQPFGDAAALLPVRERQQYQGPVGQYLAPLEVVSHHVRALRAVILHWWAYEQHRDDDIVKAWTSSGFADPGALGAAHPIEVAWDWWADHVNAALAPFTVGVAVESTDGDQGRKHGWNRPVVTAYSAMMLQVLNDVASETAWRTCANEPCGRIFARQQGRAEYGQHRSTGIRYCTRECARAQGERERRRARKGMPQ